MTASPGGSKPDRTRYFRDLAERIDTLPLQGNDNVPVRALVVVNLGERVSGRVRFAAAFPIRREMGSQPVAVRDYEGNIVPSRLTIDVITESENLPAGRVLWTMELEFVLEAIHAKSWMTFSAVFVSSPESRSKEASLFEQLPLLPLIVMETECHAGDLPLIGALTRYSRD